MEKGEQDFKYKVDQVQESLADAHKAHLRQVCPFSAFQHSHIAFCLPMPLLCLVAPLPLNTHALPSAYPSAHWMLVPCLLCLVAAHIAFQYSHIAFWLPSSAHWMPLLCLLCLVAPLPFDTHALPSAYSSLPTGWPCCASCALWQHRLSILTHLPLASSSVPTECPCRASCALWQHKSPFRRPALGVHLCLLYENTS